MAYVPQSPHIFTMTLGENVVLGRPDADDSEVAAALADAGADFVADLPDGLDTLLGESGTHLSAGQTRRIALARALLRRAPLLLPMSPPQRWMPRQRRGSFAQLGGDRTVVLVAHRPALLAIADRVVELPAPAEPDPWRVLIPRAVGAPIRAVPPGTDTVRP